ncbi:MAG: DnaD domain protein [Clostridia bacterium]|nr:DnaD domain protein [Clostridia bacterium]
MSFSINLGKWNNIFAVPCSLVDNHIKLAGAAQIKVLLFLLRYAGQDITIQNIAKSLAMSPLDVKDAMQYWIETNLINENIPVSDESENTKNVNLENLKSNNIRPLHRRQRSDPDFVAKRITESKEVNFLMQEAQVILSRPISNADSAALLMFHDDDGLPIDVILMLLQYAVSIGKCHMNYIDKIARTWGEEEIDTIEKAERKIKLLESKRRAWIIVEKVFGIEKRSPTTKEGDAADKWINSWGISEELLKEAYDRCVDTKGKYILSYIDTIIKKWHSEGIKTVKQANDEKRKNKSQNTNKSDFSPSYDINEYYNSMDIFA